MPPFDFPASPAVGEVSNGYQWTGEMWGGAPKLGTDMSEQFFNLAGLSNLDIQVPVWAKGVQLIGNVYIAGNNQIVMRASFDGTTFASGASDYYFVGPSHNTGSAGYTTQASTAAAQMYLTPSGNDPLFPFAFTAEMNVAKASTSPVFVLKVYGKAQDPNAASLSRTQWWECFPATPTQGSNLAIKALRIFPFTPGTFSDGWVKVKWLGDIAQLPPSNGIADAPADGAEYVRINNAWRLKSQRFDILGQTDVVVPDWAKGVIIDGHFYVSAAATYAGLQVSIDGTTFYAGTSYQLAGGITHNVTGGYATQAPGAAPHLYLDYPRNNLNVPHIVMAQMTLDVPVVGQLISFRSQMQAYDNTSLSGNLIWGGYLNVGVSPGRVKAFRVLPTPSGTFVQGSWFTVRWN